MRWAAPSSTGRCRRTSASRLPGRRPTSARASAASPGAPHRGRTPAGRPAPDGRRTPREPPPPGRGRPRTEDRRTRLTSAPWPGSFGAARPSCGATKYTTGTPSRRATRASRMLNSGKSIRTSTRGRRYLSWLWSALNADQSAGSRPKASVPPTTVTRSTRRRSRTPAAAIRSPPSPRSGRPAPAPRARWPAWPRGGPRRPRRLPAARQSMPGRSATPTTLIPARPPPPPRARGRAAGRAPPRAPARLRRRPCSDRPCPDRRWARRDDGACARPGDLATTAPRPARVRPGARPRRCPSIASTAATEPARSTTVWPTPRSAMSRAS